MNGTLLVGDNLPLLRKIESDSIDSTVTDPPYGLDEKEPDPREVLSAWLSDERFSAGGSGFMGESWDACVPSPVLWMECFRVMKPGAHLLAFSAPRTYDWVCLGLRLAGFEIRDHLVWCYSGFPRAKQLGQFDPEWEGWASKVKPSIEPIVVARKPLAKRSLIKNVQAYGTGALNVDGCRIPTDDDLRINTQSVEAMQRKVVYGSYKGGLAIHKGRGQELGRYPAGLLHDGSDEVMGLFPIKDGQSVGRFFYCAKARPREKDLGLDDLPVKQGTDKKNYHMTVKPVALMEWLVKLATPPGGRILDPFSGSGTTLVAAENQGFQWLGMERETDFATIAWHRARYAAEQRAKSIVDLLRQ